MEQAKTSGIRNFFEEKGQIKSYICMVLSSIAWVYGYVFANQHNFSPAQTNLSRSIVMVIGTYYICRMMNLNIQYKSAKSWRVLLQRHGSFILQGFVLAGVQFVMPLGIVHTLASGGPIITLILQRFLRKNHVHHITGNKLKGCFIAFIGIILTSNGKFIYSYFDETFEFKSGFHNYVSTSFAVVGTATVILIVSMILWSYGVLITQEAQCHSFEIVFHFAVSNLIFSSVAYLFLTEKRPAGQMYESLIWVGAFLLLAQICFTLSLNLSENIALTNITAFFNVVVGYGIGVLRYGETIDAISLFGTVLVLCGVAMVILTKIEHQNDTSSESSGTQTSTQKSENMKNKEYNQLVISLRAIKL